MKQTASAMYSFLSSFGLPVYVENYVPESQSFPYITYQLAKPDWQDRKSIFVRVWYRDTSYKAISEKVDEIEAAIDGGKTIPCGDGLLFLTKDANFCQFQPMEDDRIKVAYLSLILQVFKS